MDETPGGVGSKYGRRVAPLATAPAENSPIQKCRSNFCRKALLF
jgi:hypothetical protein